MSGCPCVIERTCSAYIFLTPGSWTGRETSAKHKDVAGWLSAPVLHMGDKTIGRLTVGQQDVCVDDVNTLSPNVVAQSSHLRRPNILSPNCLSPNHLVTQSYVDLGGLPIIYNMIWLISYSNYLDTSNPLKTHSHFHMKITRHKLGTISWNTTLSDTPKDFVCMCCLWD